jgi:hypothetical protein
MIAKTIHFKEATVEEARQLYKTHQEYIITLRKEQQMPGKPGEAQIIRLAVELGLPLLAKQLSILEMR